MTRRAVLPTMAWHTGEHMAGEKKTRSRLSVDGIPSWRLFATIGAVAAVLAYGVSPLAGGSPVQRTIVAFIQDAMWIAAAACAVAAGAVYALRRYLARRADPYARLRLAHKPQFDMPRLGPRASALAVGDPIIRIRELPKTPRPDRWSPELLRELEWKHFDILCAAYYGHRQFRIDSAVCTPDGGSHAKLYFKDLHQPVAMLGCKAWGGRPIGVKPLRELAEAMQRHLIPKGIFHASADYTNDARAYARENRIQLVSGKELVANIRRLPEPVQKALLDLTTSGDYTTPMCPACGEKMVMCTSDRGDFWGCSGYPECKATLAAMHTSW
jgi:restriction system protein